MYRARDGRLDRSVAIKILRAELSQNTDAIARFEQEARAASSLNHPHILHIYDVGQAQLDPASAPFHYMAMELVDGETLREKIDQNTPLKRLLDPLIQVADALSKAHDAGIVHRDLKPENIIISRDGYAKVLDFGLAKLVGNRAIAGGLQESDATARHAYTASGVILGTVGYMSPEQVEGKPVDQRSDTFSFGCILYEVVTGARAFRGRSAIETLNRIVSEEPASIGSLRPGAPLAIQRIVRRCLSKEREERYQSIQDVAIELRELKGELVPASDGRLGDVMVEKKAWTRSGIAGGVFASLLIIGLVSWLIAKRPGQSMPTPKPATSSAAGAKATKYTGKRIDLDLKNVEIKDALRPFAELTGLNIAMDPGVKGTVTFQMKQVPWDQALETLLRTYGLTYVLEGNVMRITQVDTMIHEQEQARKLRELERAAQAR